MILLNSCDIKPIHRIYLIKSKNFYENWMPPRDVIYAIEDVKKFVERMRKPL
jgi:hypothetical protein